MPELPEVETVRRGLRSRMVGRRIERVEVLDTRLVMPVAPAHVERELAGRTVEAVDRRGKYLLVRLDDDLVALHHLRMTGSFAIAGDGEPPRHVRMRYHLSVAPAVLYNDPRRFGTLLVAPADVVDDHLAARLGPEPLDPSWDADDLHARLRRRTAPLKAVLLDQRVVAGLGNIYVDEACFLAGVRPDVPADTVSRAVAGRLVEAVRARLAEAIEVGGSTLRDYRGVEGEAGGMQERFLAYGRAGRPCLVCGTTMRGATVAGRGTSWCPSCQGGGRSRRSPGPLAPAPGG